MRVVVLGAAAGGGFPQWNCGCAGCTAVREGRPGVLPRTQDSIAATADGARWVVVNASPDIHAQIKATPPLWPKSARHSPIEALILTNGDMDHVLGLFSLRESHPLALYATEAVWRGLEASVFIRTMKRFEGQLVVRALPLDEPIALRNAAGADLGLVARAFPAPGKLPVHLMQGGAPSPHDNVGIALRAGGGPTTGYVTACATLDGLDLAGHAALLFDGTFFREDELVRQGLSTAVAKDMAHVPIANSMERLARLGGRKIFTHVNNTNPILLPGTEEHRAVIDAGFEIAYDGMEIVT